MYYSLGTITHFAMLLVYGYTKINASYDEFIHPYDSSILDTSGKAENSLVKVGQLGIITYSTNIKLKNNNNK